MLTNSSNLSYWTKSTIEAADVTIIGGGVVGISAAISLMEADANLRVVVLDKAPLLVGASVRNAGFACFGSVSEIMDDISRVGELEAVKTVGMRWRGLAQLRSRCTDEELSYSATGGYEVYEHVVKRAVVVEQMTYINQLLAPVTGVPDCYSIGANHMGVTVHNRLEGLVNPGVMMASLYRKATVLGVQVYGGVEVAQLDAAGRMLCTSVGELRYRQLLIATNAWSKKLLPKEDVLPARNHVLVTSKLAEVPISGGYHMDRGYIYFRNVGKRVLIGGARNIVGDAELTYEMDEADTRITNHLIEILKQRVLPGCPAFTIEYQWRGLLGVGEQKQPIVAKHDDHITLAFRMGGMGVAIGTDVGERAASMILDDSNNGGL